MTKSLSLPLLKLAIDGSMLNKSYYRVDVSLDRVAYNLSFYCENYRSKAGDDDMPNFIGDSASDFVIKYAAKFQRNNDKWDEDRQICFIENIIKGYKTEIILYVHNDDYKKLGYTSCKIIDGLQRATAITRFLNGEIKAFGYTFEELKEARIVHTLTTISFRIYQIDSEVDAVRFYIEMNEGITHSEEDINKAMDYMASLGFV